MHLDVATMDTHLRLIRDYALPPSVGLGYIPTEDDAGHMARLRRERVRAHMSGIPFDYPLRSYTFQFAYYFTRGSEYAPRTEGVGHVSKMAEIQGIQLTLGQMCLSSETIESPKAMIVDPITGPRQCVFHVLSKGDP